MTRKSVPLRMEKKFWGGALIDELVPYPLIDRMIAEDVYDDGIPQRHPH